MKCKKCGTEYESDLCPNGCDSNQKTKKPIYKKWWFWLLMGHVSIIAIISLGINGFLTASFIDGFSSSFQTDDNNSGSVYNNEENASADENTNSQKTNSNLEDPVKIKSDYIASCEPVAYDDIARYPDTYKGKDVYFKGKVLQVSEGTFTSKNTYRIEVTEDEYGYWDDPVLVEYKIPEGAANILEDDIVTFYGECTGTTSYKSVLGNTITIPSVAAKYIDIVQ